MTFGIERNLLAWLNPTRKNEHGVLFSPQDMHAFLRFLDVPHVGFQTELPESLLCVLPLGYHLTFEHHKKSTLARIDYVDEMSGGWVDPGQLIAYGNVTYYSVYHTDALSPKVVVDRFSTRHGNPYFIRRANLYATSDQHFSAVLR